MDAVRYDHGFEACVMLMVNIKQWTNSGLEKKRNEKKKKKNFFFIDLMAYIQLEFEHKYARSPFKSRSGVTGV
ncbi:hypothetical protein BpHYR1_025039 [Brachionus plicatilis]|uniref:Uncharacterized protein n=1 Tax=Brachionus plicatilis TaxID=10195 RepID=A0A3M7RP63_BRAPC|nr:hypothetical protein BpHYR1_025039 [Brachionus plicatilis]